MKKLIISIIFAISIMFIGCSATDGVYNAGKKVYVVGENIVEATGIENENLSNIDKVAKSYDEARTTIRELQDGDKMKCKASVEFVDKYSVWYKCKY
jgi:hypothetical protein